MFDNDPSKNYTLTYILDNNPVGTITAPAINTSEYRQLIYYSDPIRDGQHSLIITYITTDDQFTFFLDYLVYTVCNPFYPLILIQFLLTRVGLETQPSPNATSSSVQMNGSKSNVGTISGSVAGAVAIVAVLLYIFFDRRRRDSIHVCRHDLGTSANPCLEYKY
jgi:hypothetical protein